MITLSYSKAQLSPLPLKQKKNALNTKIPSLKIQSTHYSAWINFDNKKQHSYLQKQEVLLRKKKRTTITISPAKLVKELDADADHLAAHRTRHELVRAITAR